ncbi:MAG: 50S ribosomal protein L18 [Thermoplasmata archaeon]
MTRGPRYRVPFRRRREGRTDYRRRLSLLKAGKPRAVVRKTLSNTIVQFILFSEEGDQVVASAFSKELEGFSWEGSTGNVPAAYLTGYLAAKRARAVSVEEAVLDIGLHPPSKGGRVLGALRGILDAGIRVPHDEDILSEDSRIRGTHISEGMMGQFETVKAKLEALS